MSAIVLIRHAETDIAGRFCGHRDPDLNSVGESQVIRLAEEVAMLGIERIYSSDLRRASRTAMAIGQRIGVDVNYLPGLREIHFGQWEGLSWQEIEDQFPDEAHQWLREFPLRKAPGGEAYSAFTARIEAAIEHLSSEAASGVIAVVTHRGVMRYALTRFFGFSEEEAWSKTAPYGAIIVATERSRDCEVLP
jgi:alpha-ribazole phosphatase/probable phosphoglycerate mutase